MNTTELLLRDVVPNIDKLRLVVSILRNLSADVFNGQQWSTCAVGYYHRSGQSTMHPYIFNRSQREIWAAVQEEFAITPGQIALLFSDSGEPDAPHSPNYVADRIEKFILESD